MDGVELNKNGTPFLVIGKNNTKYGQYLTNKFKSNNKIIFLGAIYNQNHLNNLRYYSNLYFHGHSVGGTNPSLLEAMASNALVVAHENIFNKSILDAADRCTIRASSGKGRALIGRYHCHLSF